MAQTKTHEGGCHCGNVRYQVTIPLGEVMECNCSICSKTAWLLAFAPADQFRLVAGADRLADYQFGKKHLHHHFCPVCGVRSFARGKGPDGKEMVAVNVRCLDGVDVASLAVKQFDGASL
jgi:hypothetical protein